MNVTLPVFLKHAEKVTKTAPESRPILNGVNYLSDGSIAVTDSHRMYIAKGVHSQTESITQNPKTGETIDGNYPDVTRLLPEVGYERATIKLGNVDYHVKSVKAVQQVATIPKVIGDKFTRKDKTTVKIKQDENNNVILTASDCGGVASYTLGIAENVAEAVRLTVNAEYLSQALQVFKDAGIDKVSFNYYGSVRPFTLVGGNMTALILPMRDL